jgi:hypothetical protein
LQHGQRTQLGFLREGKAPMPAGAAVSLADSGWQGSDAADFLILHRNLPEEVRAYWEWVYRDDAEDNAEDDAEDNAKDNAEPSADPTVNVLMQRHASNWSRQWVVPDVSMLRRFEDALGPPIYDDAQVIVWSLHGATLP